MYLSLFTAWKVERRVLKLCEMCHSKMNQPYIAIVSVSMFTEVCVCTSSYQSIVLVVQASYCSLKIHS
jgi:hypothetical protein